MTARLCQELFKRKMLLLSSARLKTQTILHGVKTNTNPKDAVRLAYEAYNSTHPVKEKAQTPIVILHGLFGSKNNWHSLAKAILSRTQRKVITVDARNHGDSPHVEEFSVMLMMEDVVALLDELKLKKVIVVGHSMGGRTAMCLALKKPSYVERLVVVDMSPVSVPQRNNVPELAKAMADMNFPQGLSLSQVRKQALVSLQAVEKSEAVRQFLTSNIVEVGKMNYQWRFNADAINRNIYTALKLPQISTSFQGPTLFIRGGESPFIPEEDVEVIQRTLFPNSRFHAIQGAGHFVHSDKPVEFVEVLGDYLSSNDV